MNDKDYEALPGIRRSDLALMAKSPLHCRYHLDHKDEMESSSALIFGQAAHKFILENETFFDEFAFMPDVNQRAKAGKEVAAAFQMENNGKTILDWKTQDVLRDMREALFKNKQIREILTREHRTEVPFYWQDTETGEICKVKADIITEISGYPYVIDYKTTKSCADGEFERDCRRYGYDLQAGMYCEGINICTVQDNAFAFIVQEKTAPYASRIFYCDEGFVDQGRKKFHRLLKKYHECEMSGIWLGYPDVDLYGEE